MMNYEYFKEVVKERLADFLPETMKDSIVDIQPIKKVNTVLDGITIKSSNDPSNVVPTVYMNDLYKAYERTGNMEEIIRKAVEALTNSARDMDFQVPNITKENVLDGVVFQLINTEQNRSLLDEVPNRPFQDLSIVYRWVINQKEGYTESAMVTENFAEHYMLSEQELYDAAKVNTLQICQPKIQSIDETMREIFKAEGMPEELIDVIVGDIPQDRMLWIMSNKSGLNGAHTMLYDDLIHDLSEKIGSNLYIMPSSIHEVIAVSADIGDPETLADLVSEVNMNEVALSDRLSNQVYHYDKDKRELSMATDSPNKRLDQMNTPDMQKSELKKNFR